MDERGCLIAIGESGYRFADAVWDRPSRERFDERVLAHVLPAGGERLSRHRGVLEPGTLRRINPYPMTGVGVAFNVVGDTRESDTPVGGPTVVNRYPGATRTSLLWTAGGGVQYRVANGVAPTSPTSTSTPDGSARSATTIELEAIGRLFR